MSLSMLIYVIYIIYYTRHTRACEMSDTCPPHGLLASGRRTCEQSLLPTHRRFDHRRAKEEHQRQRRTVEDQQQATSWNSNIYCLKLFVAHSDAGPTLRKEHVHPPTQKGNALKDCIGLLWSLWNSWITGSQSQCGSSSQRSALDVTGEGLGIQCLEPRWLRFPHNCIFIWLIGIPSWIMMFLDTTQWLPYAI